VSVKLVTGSATGTVPVIGWGNAVGWLTKNSTVAAPISEAERPSVMLTVAVGVSVTLDFD
jgi:hypothetical protein